jgi:hypothetical protein
MTGGTAERLAACWQHLSFTPFVSAKSNLLHQRFTVLYILRRCGPNVGWMAGIERVPEFKTRSDRLCVQASYVFLPSCQVETLQYVKVGRDCFPPRPCNPQFTSHRIMLRRISKGIVQWPCSKFYWIKVWQSLDYLTLLNLLGSVLYCMYSSEFCLDINSRCFPIQR